MHQVVALLVAGGILAAPANADPRHYAGRKDGVSFDYTVELGSNNDLLFRGVYPDFRKKFTLKVDRHGHVVGEIGNEPVAFEVGRAAYNKIVTQLRPSEKLVAVTP